MLWFWKPWTLTTGAEILQTLLFTVHDYSRLNPSDCLPARTAPYIGDPTVYRKALHQKVLLTTGAARMTRVPLLYGIIGLHHDSLWHILQASQLCTHQQYISWQAPWSALSSPWEAGNTGNYHRHVLGNTPLLFKADLRAAKGCAFRILDKIVLDGEFAQHNCDEKSHQQAR